MKRIAAIAVLGIVLTAGCGGGGGSGSDAFCRVYLDLQNGDLSTADVGDPATLQAALEEATELVEKMVDAAPDEIRDAAVRAQAFYEQFVAIVAKYDYDLERALQEGTPEEQAVFEALAGASAGGAAPEPALEELEQYAADNCEGVDATSGTEKFSTVGSAIN